MTAADHPTFRQRLQRFTRRNGPYIIILIFIFFFLFVYFFNSIVISIYPGQLGVLWLRLGGGTVVETPYGEGVHLILPINRMYVYDTRKQRISDAIDVLTADGMMVHVEYSVRFYPNRELLPLLHQSVGPNYASVVVIPEVRSVIRTIFGQNRPEEIYKSQKEIQEHVLSLAKNRLEMRYVSLDAVPIELIVLPKRITDAIEAKLAQDQLRQEYDFRLAVAEKEAKRKVIEAGGQNTYNTVLNASLTPELLRWQGILATRDLATSNNAKTVVIGQGANGLPIILGRD